MESSHGRSSRSRRSGQNPAGSPGARSTTPQYDGSLTMESGIKHSGKRALLHMPVEIVAMIVLEWTMLEWFAPAIARQICRYLKQITDSSPHVWSKLSISFRSHATAHDVGKWLKRSRSVPKEILLQTNSIDIVRAALEGAKDATSLLYRVPVHPEEVIQLPIQMPRLRHLHLDTPRNKIFVNMSDIFGLHNPSCLVTLPCLTILNLFFIDVTDFHIAPGLFPVIRRLVLHSVYGPILDLVRVCSRTLEHLRVSMNFTYDIENYPHGPICLPNLKVLFVEYTWKFVSNLETPAVRLIHGHLLDIYGYTRPFSSLVEWVTRSGVRIPREIDITDNLKNMPNLRHLMISQHIRTLQQCFASLRDNPSICPYLQSIEVVDFTDIKLNLAYKAYLKACVAWRAEKIPGFTLRFVENDVQKTRVDEYYEYYDEVSLFIVMRHYLSHHAF